MQWKRDEKEMEKKQKSSGNKVNWNGVELGMKMEWKIFDWKRQRAMEWKWNGNGMEMEWKWTWEYDGIGLEMEWKWNEDGNIQKICYRIEDGIEIKLKAEWDFTQKKPNQKYR